METRDALTQVLNRGAFDTGLQSAVDDAGYSNEPLTLVMTDIDHFKKVNDGHGHQFGDKVLQWVAQTLESVARRKGKVYRYGGEEFALILPNHSPEEGATVAERARREIETGAIDDVQITASFGVASFPEHASDAIGLIRSADVALYDAKNRGRNLVRIHGEPEPVRPGPRESIRKTPEAGRLTDQERADIRRRVLRREQVACPDDGAFLEVLDVTQLGSIGRDFLITCPECGRAEKLPGGQS